MSSKNRADVADAARGRIDRGLEAVRLGLSPYVAKHMNDRYGEQWRDHASRARGGDAQAELDVYGLLKTLLDNWSELFRHDQKLRNARSFISHALDARNRVAHFSGEMSARETLRYLDAMRELLAAVEAKAQVATVEVLYEEQRKANGVDRSPQSQLELEPPAPDQLRPWREVCEPHPDVLEARFSDAEFAANLALVDEGVGAEEYTDPAAFFRITYATEGLRRVLISTISRLAGRGGDPVISLQTNFGGGKTHTMLALYHLGGAAEAGYRPEDLHGLRPLFDAAGVDTLGPVQRAVFVGTHKGASEAMHVQGGRELRTPWGYLVWRLGGWKAVETIADSERVGTNPGSQRLIPILREAAPCLILMDEVVAFARQLRDLQYDAFHAFVQSLTEAATAVPGAVVVGSLPESGTEVGDEQGHEALRRLEKIFGRVQTAWTPASGIETFEIVRRRLFQPFDEAGERARDETIQAFRRLYRDNRADFPAEVREPRVRGSDAPGLPPAPRGAAALLGRLVGTGEVPANTRNPQDHGERGVRAVEQPKPGGAHHAGTPPLLRPEGAHGAPGAPGPGLRGNPAIGGGRRSVATRAHRGAAASTAPCTSGDARSAGCVLRNRPARGRSAGRHDRHGASPGLCPAG